MSATLSETPVSYVFGPSREYTKTMSSTVAYLIGVRQSIFENEHEPLDLSVYENLEQNTAAKSVRQLMIIRTSLIYNYLVVQKEFKFNLKNLDSVPDLIPTEAIEYLASVGINIVKANYQPNKYLISITAEITKLMTSIKKLFPSWVEWSYVKELFTYPSDETMQKTEYGKFLRQRNYYPYQMYIYWKPYDCGNMLYSDKKFLEVLYGQNKDEFKMYDRVIDAPTAEKNALIAFLNSNDDVVVAVDCENADAFKLYSAIKSLSPELTSRINKIRLYNDVNTSSAWSFIRNVLSDITVEEEIVERVTARKSLVDVSLTAGLCKEYYDNKHRSFILVSSDSDFWAVVNVLHDANFLICAEEKNITIDYEYALSNTHNTICFIDDFSTGNIDELRIGALIAVINDELKNKVDINISELVEMAYAKTGVRSTIKERKLFTEAHAKKIITNISKDGQLSLTIE